MVYIQYIQYILQKYLNFYIITKCIIDIFCIYIVSKREQTEQSESFESKSNVETFRNYQKWLFVSRVKKDQNWQIENKYIQQFKVLNDNKLLANKIRKCGHNQFAKRNRK